jgi:allantoinase
VQHELSYSPIFSAHPITPFHASFVKVLFDETASFVCRGEDSLSTQGYSVFEGMEMQGKVESTFLRGEVVYADGNVVGDRKGQFLERGGGR